MVTRLFPETSFDIVYKFLTLECPADHGAALGKASQVQLSNNAVEISWSILLYRAVILKKDFRLQIGALHAVAD